MIICDFNVPFSDVSVGTRAGLAFGNALNAPGYAVKAIVELVKAIFLAIACAVTFGKSEELNQNFKFTCVKSAVHAVSAAVAGLGVFAPLNAMKWQGEAHQGIMEAVAPWFSKPSLANGYIAVNLNA